MVAEIPSLTLGVRNEPNTWSLGNIRARLCGMSIAASLIPELDQEASVTRRVLERVPADKLEWQPHPKSMTLGQLALHVAGTPGAIAEIAAMNEVPMPDFGDQPRPESAEELLPTLEESVAKAKAYLNGLTDEAAGADWSAVRDGQPVLTLPRIAFIRSIMLNHWYHHRGQLTVYLRLLDVPVPAVYGASADENPFEM